MPRISAEHCRKNFPYPVEFPAQDRQALPEKATDRSDPYSLERHTTRRRSPHTGTMPRQDRSGDEPRTADQRSPTWVPTEKGAHLRGRRTRNTRPETELRRAVHALGLRFRLHQELAARCTPDFALPRWRLAVFVDGCFWHGCPDHSPKQFKGPNAQKWENKLATNRARDLRNNTLLEESGWRVLRVWECEIKQDVQDVAQKVSRMARGRDQ
jgi:DNA mismatch endonuclease, patch repair protein